jgi:hypothetical protein
MFSTLRPAGRGNGSTPGSTVLWLLTRQREGSEEILISSSSGGARTLHVFSFREEAELFLSLGGVVGDGWRVSQVGAPELATVLLGPYRHVDRVTLDPLPEGLGAEPLNVLASMSRAHFARLMVGRATARTR